MEFQASQQLAQAAEVINQNPVTIQLRYLQTLTEIGVEKNTTVVFPLPMDLIGQLVGTPTNGRAVVPAPRRHPRPSPPTAPPATTEVGRMETGAITRLP